MGKAQFHEVLAHIQRGSLDMYLEKLDDPKDMPDSEVRSISGYTRWRSLTSRRAVTALKESAKEIAGTKDKIDAQFPTPRQTMA